MTISRDRILAQRKDGETPDWVRQEVPRRRFLQLLAMGGTALAAACVPRQDETPPTATSTPVQAEIEPSVPTPPPSGTSNSFRLPTENGGWTPPPEARTVELPSGTNTVRLEGIGEFSFAADDVETLRPDIFQPDRFSLFDILPHLAERGEINLDYHFDEEMNTHVIDSINGEGGWWHSAYYSGGWPEANVFRMDMYPYKNGMEFWMHPEQEERLDAIYDTFVQEVDRLASNGGQIVIPEVTIRSPSSNTLFRDVLVTPHDVRTDVLQPGVITGLDAILSLAEQGELSQLKLTWYERIGTADPVQSYWLEQIDLAEAEGTCGFVYETGARGIGGNHIHVPSGVRVTVSPEYALWFWICL